MCHLIPSVLCYSIVVFWRCGVLFCFILWFCLVTLSLQMKHSMEEFRNLATRYGDLYQSSFDADSATLRNVELYPLKILGFIHFPFHVHGMKHKNPLFFEDCHEVVLKINNVKISCQLFKTSWKINIAILLFAIT